MARDFVHTGDLVDATIDVLKGADGTTHTGGLPAGWFGDDASSNETALVLLEHGDLADYPHDKALLDYCPSSFVRGLGLQLSQGSIKQRYETRERIRVVHIRAFTQCLNSAGEPEENMSRAREYYAKTLCKALFNDPLKLLATIASDDTRTEVSLTCADAQGAVVRNVLFAGLDLGLEPGAIGATQDVALLRALPLPIWAIAVDMDVVVTTGGD